jgi:isoleucyl-tRNA synthetase
VVERLAGLIAPVLCHMAEDIWQNLPYPVAEKSVFERGWPTAPAEWAAADLEAPMAQVLELRAQINRQLEQCRSQGDLGASLEAQVHLELGPETSPELRGALQWLEQSPHPEVDNLADWLLVSGLAMETGQTAGLGVQIAKAAGEKCERCWHYESDIGSHSNHPTLCGRCVGVLEA